MARRIAGIRVIRHDVTIDDFANRSFDLIVARVSFAGATCLTPRSGIAPSPPSPPDGG